MRGSFHDIRKCRCPGHRLRYISLPMMCRFFNFTILPDSHKWRFQMWCLAVIRYGERWDGILALSRKISSKWRGDITSHYTDMDKPCSKRGKGLSSTRSGFHLKQFQHVSSGHEDDDEIRFGNKKNEWIMRKRGWWSWFSMIVFLRPSFLTHLIYKRKI